MGFCYDIVVAECKTIAFKGTSGLMIRETANTFGLITQDDRFRGILFLLSCRLTIYDASYPNPFYGFFVFL